MSPPVAPCRPPAPRLLVLALAQAFFSVGAFAATDAERIAELEKKLDRSTQLLQQLAARLQQLEGAAPRSAAAAPAAPALQAKVEALEQQVSAISSRPEPARGLEMHGFADVGLATCASYAVRCWTKRTGCLIWGSSPTSATYCAGCHPPSNASPC